MTPRTRRQAAYERAKAVLESMGNNVFHCGDVGTGAGHCSLLARPLLHHTHPTPVTDCAGEVAKLCNNLILAVSMSGVAEVRR